MPEEQTLYFNGVNGITGEYGLPPMEADKLARMIRGEADPSELPGYFSPATTSQPADPEAAQAEKETLGTLKLKRDQPFPVKEGVDALKLDQAGWAVVFPAGMEAQRKAQLKAALEPLLKLRREQAGERFMLFEDGKGYRPNERLDQFFAHQRPEVRKGPADPAEMPFYVLLVGSPEEIPYDFQYQLDVMRGVGRLDFGDDWEAYARYAQNVVSAETGKVRLPRRMAFWGAANPGDKATELSSKFLIQPLYENLQQAAPQNEIPLKLKWQFDRFVGEGQATRAQLGRLLGGDAAQTPALLMTAGHGMEFPMVDAELQRRFQGALLCQDWDGPGSLLTRDCYFAGEDVAESGNLLGTVALFFACYGGGTPRLDQFARFAFKQRMPIAPASFVAALPQRLLRQGALAVIGHVERAWGCSFVTGAGNRDQQAFVSALRNLLNGRPVGYATDYGFNLRYADIATDLSKTLDELQWDRNYVTDYELAQMWTSNNDARAYVVVGDPAARIPAAAEAESEIRPEPSRVVAPARGETRPTPAGSGGATVEAQAAGVPPVEMGAVAFGLGDQFNDLTASLRKFTAQLAQSLSTAADEIATLEVKTYTTQNLSAAAQAGAAAADQAQLRAFTRIAFDGDTQVFIPAREEGGVDQELWQAHLAMVHEAQTNRAQFLQALAELATHLLRNLKP